ncbi:Por secretion system C-terminal sorting domain-containing protein [Flavobacterium caeni]|uniref:Por secretion system C-terminal sorting domain-containing protein n=2 Tax=Flavobacterium caeni TaxID=490189 RepID=A0A1G5ECJ3_9FLAO|nr:Por secretion system C-terminal sorting domain-containing protein [Flavobacterium caeni]
MMAMLLMAGVGVAQTTFEAARDYAKLMDLTYDPTVPNKLYAATFGNHIVVSTDNGANWELLYSHPETDFLDDLRLAPGNTALTFSTRDEILIYDLATAAITYSYPIPQSGVPDAGPSWINSYDLFDGTGDTMVVDTGFSVGLSSFSKVFYTKDAGVTWSEIYYTVNHDNVFINDVAISPNNSDKIFLARGNGDSNVDGGLWVSVDDGQNWTETLAGVTLDALAFNPSDANDMMMGSSIGFGIHPEALYRSADNGATWSTVPITWTDETLNNITKIVYNPQNPDQIIALEENEIVRTNDGGTTWTNVVYPVGISMDYYYGINASYNPSNGNQIAVTTDLYPQMFDNTAETLTQIEAPFFYVIGASVAKYSDEVHLYYGGQGGRHHKNINTGVASAYDVENPDSFNPKRNYMVADPAVAGRVFSYASMGFFGGWLTMSTDYGATTTNILQAFADDMQELTIDPNNTNIIYVSMRSGEGGNMVKIDVSDLGNIITTDIATPQVTEFGDGVITGIVIDPVASNTIYIAKRHKILKTTDGGLNWEEIGDGLEQLTEADIIWDMQGNPLHPGQLTVGTNIGVYTSMDWGANWTSILAGTDAKRVKHSPLNDGVLVVSIFSTEYVMASIAYTANNGETWNHVTPQDIHYAQAYAMDYDFDGNDINAYIATSDLGIMRYPIENAILSVDDVVAQQRVGLYPNPARNQLNIFASGDAIAKVALYSVTGQKVMERSEAAFDVSSLDNGIYLVTVQTESGKSFTKKLVKQ